MPKHLGDLLAHQRDQGAVGFVTGQGSQPLPQRGADVRTGLDLHHVPAPRASGAAPPVGVDDDERRVVVVKRTLQRADREVRPHRDDPTLAQPFLDDTRVGREPAVRPRTPRHRGRDEPVRPTLFGEGVQVGVGGGVVSLARVAEHADRR